jgi:S-formylglutathione hydrolase FrmB
MPVTALASRNLDPDGTGALSGGRRRRASITTRADVSDPIGAGSWTPTPDRTSGRPWVGVGDIRAGGDRDTDPMVRLRCDFFSEVLELGTTMTVLLPQPAAGQIGVTAAVRAADPPVLYLLHGLTDDDTAWTRYSNIERYAGPLGLAVVMPQVHRSFYADEAHGAKFWTFLSEELPSVVDTLFRVSNRREDTFVAGLSMGGYGALKWALRHPGRFAAAASLSGALDLQHRQTHDARPHIAELMSRVYADRPVAGTDDDLFHLLEKADPATLPQLFVGCGTEDALYPDSQRLRDACRQRGIELTVQFGPGEHEWGYWDRTIQQVLDWLPVQQR